MMIFKKQKASATRFVSEITDSVDFGFLKMT
jgi:hypothetical protein